jgi:Bifunctional DNA primase/polymerase, N-terminal
MIYSKSSPSFQQTLAVYRTALIAHRAGVNAIPIPADGTKRPRIPWKVYQHRRATVDELTRWFSRSPNGIALIMGAMSDGLETLDFDTREAYQQWCERMRDEGLEALHLRVAAGYLEASPHGIHLLYRCRQIEGNQKLATIPVEGPQRCKTLIETRGEGGLVVVAPSSGGVHPSGKPYVLLQGGISTIQTITDAERQALLSIARAFDRTPPPPEPSASKRPVPHLSASGRRPGDCYNQRATWEEVLKPHGWELLYTRDEEGYWQRPGKETPGVSATTNYAGSDRLYVFSTSTVFEAGRGYSKFAAYTFLTHSGNFSAAAKALVKLGYAQ